MDTQQYAVRSEGPRGERLLKRGGAPARPGGRQVLGRLAGGAGKKTRTRLHTPYIFRSTQPPDLTRGQKGYGGKSVVVPTLKIKA